MCVRQSSLLNIRLLKNLNRYHLNLLALVKILVDQFTVEDQMVLKEAKVVRGVIDLKAVRGAIGHKVVKEAEEVKAVKKEVVHRGTNLQRKEAR